MAFGVCMLSSKFYARSDMGGGLERSARRLFGELLAAGWRVFVVTRNYDRLPSREVIEGVQVHRLPIWGRSQAMISLSYLVQALVWLIAYRREYQIIHCHQSYAPATIAVLAKFLVRKPVVVKISTADAFSERRELERLPGFRVRRWLLRRVDRFVVVNRSSFQEFEDLGIASDRFLYIPNGVLIPPEVAYDPSVCAAARARVHLPERRRVAIFVGRLSAEKNLSTLVKAWAEVLRVQPDSRLLLVGDGGTFRNVEPQLRGQVERLGISAHVRFVGRVPEILDYLLAADLFVLPSSTEGMSNALLEAMAAGLAVVATRIPGNLQVIQDGENGRLVELLDTAALARAIIELLGSPDDALRLGQAARQTVAERFAIDRVGQEYLRLYAQLVNGRRAS